MVSFIEEFRTAIKNGGLTRSNRFTVLFDLPRGLRKTSYFTQLGLRKIMLFCNKANLPGISLSTAPTRTFGEVRNVPYDRNFEPLTLSFYADKGMNAKFLFDEWINLVQDRKTRQFEYWDHYVIPNLSIRVDGVDDNGVYETELHDVYPKSVSSIDLDSSNNSVMLITVVFEYRNWMSTRLIESGELDYENPDLASLAPNEMFVTIQGSAVPGITQQIAKGIASPFVPGTNSILTSAVDGLTSDLTSRISAFGTFKANTLSAYFNSANLTKYTSLQNTLQGLVGTTSSIGTALASPGGLNIAPADMGAISGMFNTARQTVGTTLAGVIDSVPAGTSIGDVATKLTNVETQLGSAVTNISSIQAKVTSSIQTASNTINKSGNLIAANQPRGQ
jgi:hypothetical protein